MKKISNSISFKSSIEIVIYQAANSLILYLDDLESFPKFSTSSKHLVHFVNIGSTRKNKIQYFYVLIVGTSLIIARR